MKKVSIVVPIYKMKDELGEKFKKNPVEVLKLYEKVISPEYLSSANCLEKLYLFSLLKLFLSPISEDKNIFDFHFFLFNC